VAAKPWAGKPHAEGGRIGRAAGGWTRVIPQKKLKKLDFPGDRKGKPHSSREGRRDSWVRGARRAVESAKKDTESVRDVRAEGGAIRVGKAFGGPSHSVRRAVKKILKKAKAKKDTESVRDVRAEGGRTGLKKGGPKPGTYDYFLLHKREKKKEGGAIRVGKAFGGPSHSVRRAVKKILKKAKAKKDTESVRDVRAGGGAIRAPSRKLEKILKKAKAKKDTESVKDVR